MELSPARLARERLAEQHRGDGGGVERLDLQPCCLEVVQLHLGAVRVRVRARVGARVWIRVRVRVRVRARARARVRVRVRVGVRVRVRV